MKQAKGECESFFTRILSPNVFVGVLLPYLAPINVMSLVRADPPLREFFKHRLHKSVYEVCVEKLHYYAVECKSTRLLSTIQWGALMNPRNVNDFLLGGGEYLWRAMVYDFTAASLPLYRRQAEFYGRMSSHEFFRVMDNSKSTINYRLFPSQHLQVHKNSANSTRISVSNPVNILHNTSVIDHDVLGLRHISGKWSPLVFESDDRVVDRYFMLCAHTPPTHIIEIHYDAILKCVQRDSYENAMDYYDAVREWKLIWDNVVDRLTGYPNIKFV